jgi:ankyrin repeat protein
MTTQQEAIDALIKHDFNTVDTYLKSNDINANMQEGAFGGGIHGTLLHCASWHADAEAVQFLLQKNSINVNSESPFLSSDSKTQQDFGNARPIHYLIMGPGIIANKAKVLDLLIPQGADINALNQFGRTASDALIFTLYERISNRLFDTLQLLADRKINVNSRQNDGKTSIYLALDRVTNNPNGPGFEYEICEFLVNKGARCDTLVNIKGTIYNTTEYALNLAKHNCYDLLKENLPKSHLEQNVKKLETAVQQLQDRVTALEQKQQPQLSPSNASQASLISNLGFNASPSSSQAQRLNP